MDCWSIDVFGRLKYRTWSMTFCSLSEGLDMLRTLVSIICAMTSATQKVASRIVRLRHQQGMTQEALAAKAGLNRVTLARLERAMHPPGLDTLEAIARALSVTLADLVK